MNPQQTKLRDLVVELLQAEVLHAEATGESLSMKEFVLKNLPGIEDGAYFELPKDFQGDRLGWLGGAYFGKGESANHLLDRGFLREDFPEEFRRERCAYLASIGYINRLK